MAPPAAGTAAFTGGHDRNQSRAGRPSQAAALWSNRSVRVVRAGKHMYDNAIFFADKLVTLSQGDPDDVYRLAQAFLFTKQYRRTLNLLRKTKQSFAPSRRVECTNPHALGLSSPPDGSLGSGRAEAESASKSLWQALLGQALLGQALLGRPPWAGPLGKVLLGRPRWAGPA